MNDLVIRRACDAFEKLPANVFLRSATRFTSRARLNRFTQFIAATGFCLGLPVISTSRHNVYSALNLEDSAKHGE